MIIGMILIKLKVWMAHAYIHVQSRRENVNDGHQAFIKSDDSPPGYSSRSVKTPGDER